MDDAPDGLREFNSRLPKLHKERGGFITALSPKDSPGATPADSGPMAAAPGLLTGAIEALRLAIVRNFSPDPKPFISRIYLQFSAPIR
jgi:hypothetical protein